MSQVDIVGVQHYTAAIGHPNTPRVFGGAAPVMLDTGTGEASPGGSSDAVLASSTPSTLRPKYGDMRITSRNGRVFVSGEQYRGVFINAHDQLNELHKGQSYYVNDLPAIAASGVRLIRVAAAPLTSADWITQVGTSAATPVAAFLTNIRTFLDAAHGAGLGVILTLYWKWDAVAAALSRPLSDFETSGSTTRAYMKDLAARIARDFKNHPALAAYQIGNEWFDYAATGRFVTATSDTTKDHFGALVGTINDIVAGIRSWDNDRAILSPHGSGGRYEGGNVQTYIRKFVASIGNCDVADYHLYPDTDRTGFAHIGVGAVGDMGSTTSLLTLLRGALMKEGKGLIVSECGADDDHPSYGSPAVGTVSQLSWRRAHDAGVDLVGDWGWYGDPILYATSAANLKLYRNAVMSLIGPYNSGLSQAYVAPPQVYPSQGETVAPKICARGAGSANSFVRIPNHPDMSIDVSTSARFYVMFWLRKRSQLASTARFFANNDGNNNGIFMSTNTGEGVSASLGFGVSGFINATGNGGLYNYPADMPADPSISLPWEWHHVALAWDGVVRPAASGGDDKQHISCYIDGFEAWRQPTTSGKTPSAASTRDTYLLSSSDGLGGFAAADICDVIVGKGQFLTTENVWAYLQNGTLPPGALHRWKLDGNTLDSIGTLHAVAGSALTFVASGL